MRLAVRPLTKARFADVESIFTSKGCAAARGCWCMYYRASGAPSPLRRGESRAEANREALARLADADPPAGLIGYCGKQPVGWMSRSPVMKAVDDMPVWSVICFVVRGDCRGQGVARQLLDGAIAFARRRGVKVLEAYPVDRAGRARDDALWFGTKSMYDDAGFTEVARRRPDRPVVRRVLGG